MKVFHECNVAHKEKKSAQSRVYTYMMTIYDIRYLFGEDIWRSIFFSFVRDDEEEEKMESKQTE